MLAEKLRVFKEDAAHFWRLEAQLCGENHLRGDFDHHLIFANVLSGKHAWVFAISCPEIHGVLHFRVLDAILVAPVKETFEASLSDRVCFLIKVSFISISIRFVNAFHCVEKAQKGELDFTIHTLLLRLCYICYIFK